MELHCIEIKFIFVSTIYQEQKIYIIIKGVLLMNVMTYEFDRYSLKDW